jgi:hypothetical protein
VLLFALGALLACLVGQLQVGLYGLAGFVEGVQKLEQNRDPDSEGGLRKELANAQVAQYVIYTLETDERAPVQLKVIRPVFTLLRKFF